MVLITTFESNDTDRERQFELNKTKALMVLLSLYPVKFSEVMDERFRPGVATLGERLSIVKYLNFCLRQFYRSGQNSGFFKFL